MNEIHVNPTRVSTDFVKAEYSHKKATAPSKFPQMVTKSTQRKEDFNSPAYKSKLEERLKKELMTAPVSKALKTRNLGSSKL